MDKLIEDLVEKVKAETDPFKAQVWANTLRTVCLAKHDK